MLVGSGVLGGLRVGLSGSRGSRGLDEGRECGRGGPLTRLLRHSCAICEIVSDRFDEFHFVEGFTNLNDCPHRRLVLIHSSESVMGSFCHSAGFRAPMLRRRVGVWLRCYKSREREGSCRIDASTRTLLASWGKVIRVLE